MIAPDWLSDLSDDAKLILGSHFGLMITPGRGHVTFQTPWNMSPRAQAAFAEMVRGGLLSVEDGTQGLYARTYRALVDCAPARRWVGNNLDKAAGLSVTVPSAQRRERPPKGWTPLSNPDPKP